VPYAGAMDSRLALGQTPAPDLMKVPVGRGWLRPFGVVSAQVLDGTGNPLKGMQVQLLDHETRALIQQLPSDDSGFVMFPFDVLNKGVFILRPVPPEGFNFNPPERASKVGGPFVWARPLIKSDIDPREPWEPARDTERFFLQKGTAATFGSFGNPWLIGTIIIGGLIVYAQFRRS